MSHKHRNDLFDAITYAFGPVLMAIGLTLIVVGLVGMAVEG